MSHQLICDDCGEPIDISQPYFSLSGSKVQVVDGTLTVVDQSVTLDYHAEHLPEYKVLGEPVVVSPPVPEEPAITPQPPDGGTPG